MDKWERQALIESRFQQEGITRTWQRRCGELGSQNAHLRIALLIAIGAVCLLLSLMLTGCGATEEPWARIVGGDTLCGPSLCASITRKPIEGSRGEELLTTVDGQTYTLRPGYIRINPVTPESGDCSRLLQTCDGWVPVEEVR